MRKLVPALLLSLLAVFGCSNPTVISDTISPVGPVVLDAGQSVTFTAVVAGDSSNAGVTWSLSGAGTLSAQTGTTVVYTAPAPVTLASTAVVSATPVNNALYTAATQINYGSAPAITSTTLPAASVGLPYSFQLGASGGIAPFTFSLTSGTLPAGLTLSTTGLLAGTPTAPGSSTLTFQVTDSAATRASASATLTLNVNASTLSVSIASAPNGVTGTAYSYTFATAGGAAPYTWSVASGALPAGLTLSPAGVLSGSPTAAGNYSFTLSVKDTEPSPQTASKAFTLTIYNALSITTATLPQGSLRNAYSAQLTSAGGTAPTTWSLASGSLPAGLALSPAGLIAGTPTAAGTSTFAVRLTDTSSPAQTATANLTITIVTSTLAIATTTLPAATVTAPYSTTLQATGGNPPVAWSLAAGSVLPNGVTLSAAGILSGTPGTAGTYTFTVQATDSTPFTTSQALTLVVNNLATLTIATTTLPAGNLGTPYSTTFAATGGASPYTWSLVSGTLPQGLALSAAGTLSGIPLTAGSYAVTVQVRDSQATAATASRSVTLVIGTTLAAGAANAALSGPYAFLVNGFNAGSAAGQVYGFATLGSLTFDGAGNVTGTQDQNTPAGAQASVNVSGTYTLGVDNRGLLILTAGTVTNVYAISASQFTAAVAQSIALTEFDNNATAAGFARHQTPAAFTPATLAGSFAFGLSGESPCSTCATAVRLGPVVAAGVFTGNASTLLGQQDSAAYATNYSGITLAGTYTAPATTSGRGTLRLVPAGTNFAAPPTNYTYLVVNATEILLLSTDSHATTSLLYGDARLQQQATYTTASFTGRSIGYESQPLGGDGATTYPTTLAATLSQLTNTAAGTATLTQDTNRAGTFSTPAAVPVTYTTAANGRTAITTAGNPLTLYLYNTGAAFGIDNAGTSGYPALAQYELQVATIAPFPTLLSGRFAAATLPPPEPAGIASGSYVFTLNTGGVNSAISGALATTTDASSATGTLSFAQPASLLFVEDATGRLAITSAGAPAAVAYAITPTRAVALATGALARPTVTTLQQ